MLTAETISIWNISKWLFYWWISLKVTLGLGEEKSAGNATKKILKYWITITAVNMYQTVNKQQTVRTWKQISVPNVNKEKNRSDNR